MSNSNEVSAKILERIRALLAMGSDTSSEHEAAIALKRARKLMDDHQVTLSDIESVKDNDLGVSDYDIGSTQQKKWVSTLAIYVAKLNDCIVSFARVARGENKRYQFKGFKEDAAMCDFMLVYLVDTCNRFYERDKKSLGLSGIADKNDYLIGLVFGIKTRITAMIEERQSAQASDGRSLIVVKKSVVEAKFGKERYGTYKGRYTKNKTAYDAGKRSAKDIHLGNFVGTKKQSKKQLCG